MTAIFGISYLAGILPSPCRHTHESGVIDRPLPPIQFVTIRYLLEKTSAVLPVKVRPMIGLVKAETFIAVFAGKEESC
jgi:hypothetical protein